VDGKPTGPTSGTQAQYTFGDTNQHNVTYTIFCGQSVESGQSPPLAVTAQQANGGGGGGNQ
jgi:serine/threonine-protein kinase